MGVGNECKEWNQDRKSNDLLFQMLSLPTEIANALTPLISHNLSAKQAAPA